jgi:hypothetical protein
MCRGCSDGSGRDVSPNSCSDPDPPCFPCNEVPSERGLLREATISRAISNSNGISVADGDNHSNDVSEENLADQYFAEEKSVDGWTRPIVESRRWHRRRLTPFERMTRGQSEVSEMSTLNDGVTQAPDRGRGVGNENRRTRPETRETKARSRGNAARGESEGEPRLRGMGTAEQQQQYAFGRAVLFAARKGYGCSEVDGHYE